MDYHGELSILHVSDCQSSGLEQGIALLGADLSLREILGTINSREREKDGKDAFPVDLLASYSDI